DLLDLGLASEEGRERERQAARETGVGSRRREAEFLVCRIARGLRHLIRTPCFLMPARDRATVSFRKKGVQREGRRLTQFVTEKPLQRGVLALGGGELAGSQKGSDESVVGELVQWTSLHRPARVLDGAGVIPSGQEGGR